MNEVCHFTVVTDSPACHSCSSFIGINTRFRKQLQKHVGFFSSAKFPGSCDSRRLSIRSRETNLEIGLSALNSTLAPNTGVNGIMHRNRNFLFRTLRVISSTVNLKCLSRRNYCRKTLCVLERARAYHITYLFKWWSS